MRPPPPPSSASRPADPPPLAAPRSMPGFATSPILVTLLKFLDGHLSLPLRAAQPPALALAPFLVRQLAHLGGWLVDEGPSATRVKNAADAKAFEGLVLVLHCACSIGLGLEREEEEEGEGDGASAREEREERAREELAEGAETAVRASTPLSLSLMRAWLDRTAS